MSQSRWLEIAFRSHSLEIDMKQFSEKVAIRRRSMSWIQKRTLHLVKSTLDSHNHSSVESMLICQLLVDLQTCFSTVTPDSETLHLQENDWNAFDASYERNLADLLCETGDYNGALALLHRIPLTHIRKQDLNKMRLLGIELCSEMMLVTFPKILGTDDDPMILDVFEHLDALVLPYSLLAVHSSEWIENEDFIKKSFLWPWIRRSIQVQLKDQPGAPLDWQPTTLDRRFRDAFGHSFLHAANYSQGTYDVMAIINKTLELGQEEVRARLSTACPTYAPGFTPLACLTSSLGGLDVFPLKDCNIIGALFVCCGSGTGRTGHQFCALAFAIRDNEVRVAEAWLRILTQQVFDIAHCCLWARGNIPNIPGEIWDQMVKPINSLRQAVWQ